MVDDLTKGSTAGFSEQLGSGRQSADAKSQLRRQLVERRSALPAALVLQAGEAAQRRLMDDPIWKQAERVALYVSTNGETGTDLLLEHAWREGKTVLLPRVLPRSKYGPGQMVFARCCGRHELNFGVFRIPEPDRAICPVDESPAPDLIVVPAVGLDRQGFRLGVGGGYYDRLFAPVQDAHTLTEQSLGCRLSKPCGQRKSGNGEAGENESFFEAASNTMAVAQTARVPASGVLDNQDRLTQAHLERKAWGTRPRIGLVFACQIVDALPHEAWDTRVHALLSEEDFVWL